MLKDNPFPASGSGAIAVSSELHQEIARLKKPGAGRSLGEAELRDIIGQGEGRQTGPAGKNRPCCEGPVFFPMRNGAKTLTDAQLIPAQDVRYT